MELAGDAWSEGKAVVRAVLTLEAHLNLGALATQGQALAGSKVLSCI